MAKLTEAIKRTIVMELAMFRTPSEVVEVVKELHGVEIVRQQAHSYDPHGSAGADVAKKWKALHAATRKAFLADTASIPVANKAYRLRELNDMAQRAKARGNVALAAALMEQAAKECGEAFTNRRELTGKDGKELFPAARLTDEQLDQRLAQLVPAGKGSGDGGGA